jgi:chromosome segregation ATPase
MTLLDPSRRRTAIRQRLEQTWRSADVDVRYLLAALDTAEARIRELEKQLAECYRLTGADPDGNDDRQLAPYAVDEVRRLREADDTLAAQLNELEAQDTALREGIATLREYVREADCGHGGLCQIGNIEKQLADLLAAHTPEPT